jgi:hypothetical protein
LPFCMFLSFNLLILSAKVTIFVSINSMEF